jgi:endonuclease/exonuclease/phosphatase family metal-dependent hydrolase
LLISGAVIHFGAGYFEKSGQVTSYPAAKQEAITSGKNLRIINLNMENKVYIKRAELKQMIQEREPDVVMIQEANSDDVELLQYSFPNWNIYDGLADTKQEIFSGGYSDVIMSEQALKDVKSDSLAGDSLLEYGRHSALGLGEDAISTAANFDPTLKSSRTNVSENREALSGTLTVGDGENEQDIRLVTSHLERPVAGNEHKQKLHEKQFNKLKGIIKNSGDKVVACADFNAEPNKFVNAFLDIKYLPLWTYKSTLVNVNKTIDACVTHGLAPGRIRRLSKYKTDHYAIELDVPLKDEG